MARNPLGYQAIPGTDLALNPPGAISLERARDLRPANPLRAGAERLLSLRTDEAWLRITANAERKVAVDLERLGSRWRILHAIPVGPDRPAISHLIVGPPGVFTVVTRGFRALHPRGPLDRVEAQVMGDEIKIYGSSWPYLKEARAQAWRSARALSGAVGWQVFVRPVVALVGVDEVRFYDIPNRVDVLPRRQVVRFLQGFPARLDPASVEDVYTAARLGDTWLDPAGRSADGLFEN
ncbi:nuclease-related domain-containing protein [Sporichthya polymorpha]|uniref:nuclease-related domain-containing protein n=1 Tax=Sporichthya polymorpha TaxID=35751 RepID=UPI00036EB8EA|nr:nuclease-related domain-containing protein [Sporichthya polymorpha]